MRYHATHSLLVNIARRLAPGQDAVEDLVQETWVRILEHAAVPERQLPAWVFRTMQRLVIDDWRAAAGRRWREESAARDRREMTAMAPSAPFCWEERPAWLSSLTTLQRQVLTLRILEGHSIDVVAERLGLHAEAVRSHQKRALARLRRLR